MASLRERLNAVPNGKNHHKRDKQVNDMRFLKLLKLVTAASILLGINGCAVTPKNLDSLDQDDGMSFVRVVENDSAVALSDFGQALASRHATVAGHMQGSEGADGAAQRLSLASGFTDQVVTRGDIIRLRINGMPQFDGLYQIDAAGQLEVPFSDSLAVEGLSRQQLVQSIEQALVEQRWFYQDLVHADVSIVELAAVHVSVTGAVFNPGQVFINNRPAERPRDLLPQLAGTFSPDRDLIAALTAAGGIRPDADPERIYIKRGTTIVQVPLTALMQGNEFVKTPTLINGDQILVRSTGVENTNFIKPSGITPPGMRVFMSNLIAPSLSNAQGAVGADSTRLPFGTSLLDAAVSSNCVGGTHQANASRSVVLITRNYGSKQQLVVKRSINQLLANSSNHLANPFLMPNDALACYDSRFTNFRDVARGIGELISPILLGRLL
ncbi:MAG: polysaccharide export protein [Gammaproteobacteria bacterium]|nr:polysaccharide export protein [Gammaproteobacteria bacterium]